MTEENKTYNKTQIIVGIIMAAAIIGIIVLSILTYVKTVSDENTINTLWDQLVALQTQLSNARTELNTLSGQVSVADVKISTLTSKEASDISSLQNELSSATDDISTLTSQINSLVFQISGIQSEITSDAGVIASIQSQLTSINTQLSSLGNTTVSLQNTLTSLKNTVDSLVIQVNNLSSAATNPVTLFSSQPVSQAFGTQTLLATFPPTYSGNVYVSGTSSSATGYIRVTNNNTSAFTIYAFGTGTTITAPVTAGYSYSIRFGNSDASGTITATLSGTYYPTSYPGTNSVTLFSSQPVSQAFSTQTLLYNTFTPTYSGNVYVSGTSSSATGYIRVTNNNTSASNVYAFGTGTTISAPVTAGYSYSIRFGNADASGTITATLSATYYY